MLTKKVKDLFKKIVLLNAVKEAWDGISSNAVLQPLITFWKNV